ncbi:MAG: biopolymer transporter ExbB [Verrucomicrobiales bacterium]|nr:biopolymer transporter ExbB [Verrucomicrobiales bacterium]|tara:strand:- start:880 stop:1611 length:732 start_codon:yes stop_codon:yes gene_type:complete
MDLYVLAVESTDALTAWELLRQGGPMVWVLLLVSAFGVTAFLERLLYYHRAQINASEFMAGVRTVLKNDNVVEAVAICDATPGPVARMAKLGILNREQTHDRLKELLDDHSRAEVPRLEKRLNMLGTIAQIAPLLGLLGTVLGFIQIFQGVWLKGNWVLANDLAGGIWQGLVCMALGLAIAIPCTIAFNYLVGRKDDIALDIEKSNAELLNILAFELASLNINLGPKVNQDVNNDIGQRSVDQ